MQFVLVPRPSTNRRLRPLAVEDRGEKLGNVRQSRMIQDAARGGHGADRLLGPVQPRLEPCSAAWRRNVDAGMVPGREVLVRDSGAGVTGFVPEVPGVGGD